MVMDRSSEASIDPLFDLPLIVIDQGPSDGSYTEPSIVLFTDSVLAYVIY